MKVFISSTYKDLIDYRAAAIRAVEGTNYQASKMEVFGARPDEPLGRLLERSGRKRFLSRDLRPSLWICSRRLGDFHHRDGICSCEKTWKNNLLFRG